ncbi:MAG: hypothetical protein HY788_23915 [Deltaproteobacteria bacterium]|nr:hypothetical protein [Deltaproteobacteria bacterium]
MGHRNEQFEVPIEVPKARGSYLVHRVEGCPIRSTEQMTGVRRDTITRLLVPTWEGCQKLPNKTMKGLQCESIQLDEIWTFFGNKKPHLNRADNPFEMGDFWTWVALDSDTVLVPTIQIARRNIETARDVISDLRSSLTTRIQLSSDMLCQRVDAVEESFGAEVDYA